ncbi:unnamed protein product [Trichobilharzia regenti]|nr:unnamed protein product [Trichobilharzia regenti]
MDTCLSNLISVWQTLVSGLSCQLAETKLELTRSRELNEQLSKQLSETSKQLSDAVNKFIEFQNTSQIATAKSANIIPVPSASNALLETPAQELSKAISELRHWLPEGMAAAACAAVNARLSPPTRTQSFGQHQSPCRSETPIQSNNPRCALRAFWAAADFLFPDLTTFPPLTPFRALSDFEGFCAFFEAFLSSFDFLD